MSDTSLSDQFERIMASSCTTVYTTRVGNLELEKKLLGVGDDSSISLEGASSNPPSLDTEGPGSDLPAFNPLFSSNFRDMWPLVASGVGMAVSIVAWTIYLSGGLAASAAASAGVVASSASAGATSSAIQNLSWALHGGGAAYISGRASIGILALRGGVTPSTLSTHLREMLVLPSPIQLLHILKRMAVIEAWRQVWLVAFHLVSWGMTGISRRSVLVWQNCVPEWIRLGSKSIFKSSIQRAIHGVFWQWLGAASDMATGMHQAMGSPDAVAAAVST